MSLSRLVLRRLFGREAKKDLRCRKYFTSLYSGNPNLAALLKAAERFSEREYPIDIHLNVITKISYLYPNPAH